jgi:aminoglycoside 6'-N-acetyltransferase I
VDTPPEWEIVDLSSLDDEMRRQAANLLVIGFARQWPKAWPTLEAALDEVKQSLEEGKISRAALTESGEVLGWVGAIPEYYGHAWELHPLVVHPKYQGMGVGSALVRDLEALVRQRGATTIFLGTDDESELTSLGGRDLYPNVLEHLSSLENLHAHPFEFYQKLGYSVVGVIPDANGPGKPDILMAKRIDRRSDE